MRQTWRALDTRSGLDSVLQTPFGGALAVDYGFLLNPPEFLIPQRGPNWF